MIGKKMKGFGNLMPKFFVNAEDIYESTVRLSGENMHHLINVLRSREGDEVTVCDKSGFDYSCVIRSIGKEEVILSITDRLSSISEPAIEITLFQGLPKGDKLSLIVEKCVEAGVHKIIPVSMSRSVVKLSGKDFVKKKDRLAKISLSAAKQSGRGIVPEIGELISFKDFLNCTDDYDLVLFPYEEAKDISLKSAIKGFEGKKIAVIIGPEGGFSKEEAEAIMCKNISPVTLGNRILRTETAGMAAIFNILYELEL